MLHSCSQNNWTTTGWNWHVQCISSLCLFLPALIRNQWWCSSAGTSWTKRISSASPTPSWSSTGAMRTAREFPLPHPPSLSLLLCFPLHVWFNPSLHPKEIGFIDSPHIKSCCLFKHVCELHVEMLLYVSVCGSERHWSAVVCSRRLCVCVRVFAPALWALFSILQCVTSQIRPCALRAEDTNSTC